MPEASVDAIVTDPPYNLGFMNKSWDKTGVAFDPGTWREALRVLKPGGHLVAFGGTRTFHRLTCAIEDAGFEIRDCLSWLFGTGFPKSLDVGKAIDDAVGADRTVVAQQEQSGAKFKLTQRLIDNGGFNDPTRTTYNRTAPATAEAKHWDGWGTGLKPGWEPIILARKPLDGTVAANVLQHGTGALNIYECRIARPGNAGRGSGRRSGRWPANVVLDEHGAALLDEQGGTRTSGRDAIRRKAGFFLKHGRLGRPGDVQTTYGDSGGASRFFYVPKASRAEREAGCTSLPSWTGPAAVARLDGSAGTRSPRAGAGRTAQAIRNHHPTVKPIALMRWLVRLVTPPGGTLLDPFMGSGTTGCAAALEGFGFVGIEQDAEYVAIAKARICHAACADAK
jgi:site-specific DNA-methyltransferase (adenine-specific)